MQSLQQESIAFCRAALKTGCDSAGHRREIPTMMQNWQRARIASRVCSVDTKGGLDVRVCAHRHHNSHGTLTCGRRKLIHAMTNMIQSVTAISVS